MQEGKYDEAASRAKRALLIGEVPTAHAVLAATSERDGDRQSALKSYETALQLMGRERDASEFLPIYFTDKRAFLDSL